MEITFAVLLWGVRIAFLVLLYLFLIRVFSSLQRSLATENAVAARPLGLAHLAVQRTVRGAPRSGSSSDAGRGRGPARSCAAHRALAPRVGRGARDHRLRRGARDGNVFVQPGGGGRARGLPGPHAVAARVPGRDPVPRRPDP